MKKMFHNIFFIFLYCASCAGFSQTLHDYPQGEKHKRVSDKMTYCLYRDAVRRSCFRCVKPNHYGFHLYPHQIDRETCHLKTAHYLQTMGYRCYQPLHAQKCQQVGRLERGTHSGEVKLSR